MFDESSSAIDRFRRGTTSSSGTARLVNMDVWYATTLWLALLSGWIDPSSGRRTRKNPTGGILMKPIIPPALLTPQSLGQPHYEPQAHPVPLPAVPLPPVQLPHGFPYNSRQQHQHARLWRSIDEPLSQTRVPRNSGQPYPPFPLRSQQNPMYPFQTYPPISQSPQQSSLPENQRFFFPQKQNIYQPNNPYPFTPGSNIMKTNNQFGRTPPMSMLSLEYSQNQNVDPWYARDRTRADPITNPKPLQPMGNTWNNIPRSPVPFARLPQQRPNEAWRLDRRTNNPYSSVIMQDEVISMGPGNGNGMMMAPRSIVPQAVPQRQLRPWEVVGDFGPQNARMPVHIPLQYDYDLPDYFESRHSPRVAKRPIIMRKTVTPWIGSNSGSSEEIPTAVHKQPEPVKKQKDKPQQRDPDLKQLEAELEEAEAESAEEQTNSTTIKPTLNDTTEGEAAEENKSSEATSNESTKLESSQTSEEDKSKSRKQHKSHKSHKHHSETKSPNVEEETNEDHKRHIHGHNHHHSKRSKKVSSSSEEKKQNKKNKRRQRKTMSTDYIDSLEPAVDTLAPGTAKNK